MSMLAHELDVVLDAAESDHGDILSIWNRFIDQVDASIPSDHRRDWKSRTTETTLRNFINADMQAWRDEPVDKLKRTAKRALADFEFLLSNLVPHEIPNDSPLFRIRAAVATMQNRKFALTKESMRRESSNTGNSTRVNPIDLLPGVLNGAPFETFDVRGTLFAVWDDGMIYEPLQWDGQQWIEAYNNPMADLYKPNLQFEREYNKATKRLEARLGGVNEGPSGYTAAFTHPDPMDPNDRVRQRTQGRADNFPYDRKVSYGNPIGTDLGGAHYQKAPDAHPPVPKNKRPEDVPVQTVWEQIAEALNKGSLPGRKLSWSQANEYYPECAPFWDSQVGTDIVWLGDSVKGAEDQGLRALDSDGHVWRYSPEKWERAIMRSELFHQGHTGIWDSDVELVKVSSEWADRKYRNAMDWGFAGMRTEWNASMFMFAPAEPINLYMITNDGKRFIWNNNHMEWFNDDVEMRESLDVYEPGPNAPDAPRLGYGNRGRMGDGFDPFDLEIDALKNDFRQSFQASLPHVQAMGRKGLFNLLVQLDPDFSAEVFGPEDDEEALDIYTKWGAHVYAPGAEEDL